MKTYSDTSATDWNSGAYTNTILDTAVLVSPTNHPSVTSAVVPQTTATATGAQAIGATQPPGPGLPVFATNGGSAWVALDHYAQTAQTGDTLSVTTTAIRVTITLVGALMAGDGVQTGQPNLVARAIRNGGIISVAVAGTEQGPFDTSSPQIVTLYLDGSSQTIVITHTGSYNAALAPALLGAVQPGTGTSVAAHLSAVLASPTPALVAATWTLSATDATHYTLTTTPPGGSPSTVATGLLVGTTYTNSYVPGVTFAVGTGTVLTSGDSASFTTDPVQCVVDSIAFGTTPTTGTVTWTSPVLDATDTQTQWLLAGWTESEPMTGASLAIGTRPEPDGTWTTTTVPARETLLPVAGTRTGTAGFPGAPRGRYGQLTLIFPNAGTVPAWVRDLTLYAWTPEHETSLAAFGIGRRARPGPVLAALTGSLATGLADGREAMLSLQSAASVGGVSDADLPSLGAYYGVPARAGEGLVAYRRRCVQSGLPWRGARDAYLAAIGADQGWLQYTGEPMEAYQQRLAAALSSRAQGGSVPWLCERIALFVTTRTGGMVTVVIGDYTISDAHGVHVAPTGGGAVVIEIPPPTASGSHTYYPGLPGLSPTAARAVITAFIGQLMPLANAPSIIFA